MPPGKSSGAPGDVCGGGGAECSPGNQHAGAASMRPATGREVPWFGVGVLSNSTPETTEYPRCFFLLFKLVFEEKLVFHEKTSFFCRGSTSCTTKRHRVFGIGRSILVTCPGRRASCRVWFATAVVWVADRPDLVSRSWNPAPFG